VGDRGDGHDLPLACVGRCKLSNLEQQLLQNRLLEVIEADRLNDDVAVPSNDVPAIVYVEAFGRLWRKNIYSGDFTMIARPLMTTPLPTSLSLLQ